MKLANGLLTTVFTINGVLAGCAPHMEKKAPVRAAGPIDETVCIVGERRTTCGNPAPAAKPEEPPTKQPAAAYDATCMTDMESMPDKFFNARDYNWMKNRDGKVVGVEITTAEGEKVPMDDHYSCMFIPVTDPRAPKLAPRPRIPLRDEDEGYIPPRREKPAPARKPPKRKINQDATRGAPA